MEEEKDNETGGRYSLNFSPEELAALETIGKREPYYSLGIGKRKLIRAAILSFVLVEDEQTSRLEKVLERYVQRTHDLIVGTVAATVAIHASKMSPGRPVRPLEAPTVSRSKMSDEEKDDAGKMVCEALQGTIDGRSCRYYKHEVTAIGKAVRYELVEPLSGLTEADVLKQYDPNREVWQKAKDEAAEVGV